MNRARYNFANITISLDNLDNDEIANSDTETLTPESLHNGTKNGHTPNPPFADSRKKEIDELFDKGAFKFIDSSEVPTGARIFGSRFVDEIKHPGTDKAYEKLRLVI